MFGIARNVLGKSYRRGRVEVAARERFGQPLATLSNSHGTRCVYYDVVGYDTGWSLCFKHGTMTAAGGNQIPPRGVT